jgi:hypothetical protein
MEGSPYAEMDNILKHVSGDPPGAGRHVTYCVIRSPRVGILKKM